VKTFHSISSPEESTQFRVFVKNKSETKRLAMLRINKQSFNFDPCPFTP